MISIFDNAIKTNSLKEIEEINNYPFKGRGNFEEFDVKSFFPICITGYYFDRDEVEPILELIVNRHKKEGIKYIEYRNGIGGSGLEWKNAHKRYASYFKNVSYENFIAKYIVRLGSYQELKELLLENPDLREVIVGVDFSGREIDPEKYSYLFETIKNDNLVDMVIHIGENFDDKSLESAIRWCHQAALNGVKRMAHCIALGIDPEIAINRKPNHHEEETVEQRLAQIRYDLKYREELKKYKVEIDEKQLKVEYEELLTKDINEKVLRKYDAKRLTEIKNRQDFVLEEIAKLGVIIEVCPTSNLCIGGIPKIENHSFKKLYSSPVKLAICSDDPGIFASSLADEVDFIMQKFQISEEDLIKRLEDPYKYRLRS